MVCNLYGIEGMSSIEYVITWHGAVWFGVEWNFMVL